ncbi:hypothetical protein, partial [Shinella sp. JR1-6]|uniref:hypothetical protein n=1 Tax=Shinella sp. JR1-6 TaxID=2527671 RepID=UPI001A9ED229
MTKVDVTQIEKAWRRWWNELGHVARCNRDPARTREAFDAGYLAALMHSTGRFGDERQAFAGCATPQAS